MGHYCTLAAPEEENQTTQVDEAADSGWCFVSTQKWVQLGGLTQRFATLQGQYFGTCIQWRAAGVIEQLMSALHEQVREQVKKTPNGRR